MSETDTLLVIPAHNEEARIATVVQAARSSLKASVLVVDDCSRDATRARALEAGALVVTHPINLGYGSTVQTGMKYAYRRGFNWVAQLDGDGQHDAHSLPALMAPLLADEADYVIGSRFIPTPGITPYVGGAIRRIGSHALSLLVKMFTGLRITDPTSGFVAMNRRALELLTTEVYPPDYPDADLIILLHKRGFRVREVPVQMFPSTGKSMHGGFWKPCYYAYKMSLSILLTLVRK